MVETNTSHHHVLSRTTAHFSSILYLAIGLDKPAVRAKGMNHPKYFVKPEYACLTRESATAEERHPALLPGTDTQQHGVKKRLAEPYADRRLFFLLPVDMAAD
jgi:hypothetical protein